MTDALARARRELQLDTACPVCGAGFSEPCRSRSGTVRAEVHKARKHPAAVRWFQAELFPAGEGA
jgi:hypothetical protein